MHDAEISAGTTHQCNVGTAASPQRVIHADQHDHGFRRDTHQRTR